MAESKKLKNEDFRKLLASSSTNQNSRHVNKTSAASNQSHSRDAFIHHKTGTTSGAEKKKPKKRNPKHQGDNLEAKKKDDDLSDESEAKLNDILKNYRDRAAERRKGLSVDEASVGLNLLGESKESAGGVLETAIEVKKMEIQKSKYLGGDIEHTHLVKGLDYSLLNKVRTEMHEQQASGKEREKTSNSTSILNEVSEEGSRQAKRICKVLFESKAPQRNDLFARGRMAYLVDLDEEEQEVPSTLLRSVYDTQADQSNENINADNLLINKLSQVLAYLRTDTKKKKKGSSETAKMGVEYQQQQQGQTSIFEGLDEYVPSRKKEDERKKKEEESGQHSGSYFARSAGKGRKEERPMEDGERAGKEKQRLDRKRQQEEEEEKKQMTEKEEMLQKKRRKLEEEDAYAEFYPGGIGMMDAAGESDDDDLTLMDQGNRKPPVKRWDFESQEEFEQYQSKREANPKAAYQFGLKRSGGRKTRKSNAAANERKIDRELDKINQILEKGVSKNVRY